MKVSRVALVVSAALLVARQAGAQELPAATVQTDPPFDPTVDGLKFENSGDFESPDGNCFGMSLMAISRFLQRKEKAGPTHAAAVKKVRTEAASVPQEEQVSYLQQHVSENPMHEAKLKDPKNILASLLRIQNTRIPEIFTMTDNTGAGHANVIFGYKNGCVLLLDPNYPLKTLAWPFDFKNGFGKHPLSKSLGKGKDFYASLVTAGATPYAKFKATKEIEALSDPKALKEASLPRYPSTTAKVTPGDPITITGTIAGGPKKDEDGNKALKPNRVWLTVDGKPVAHANVRGDGSFHLTLPKKVVTDETKTVEIVTTIDETDANAQNKQERFHMFSGAIDLDPKDLLGKRNGLVKGLEGVGR